MTSISNYVSSRRWRAKKLTESFWNRYHSDTRRTRVSRQLKSLKSNDFLNFQLCDRRRLAIFWPRFTVPLSWCMKQTRAFMQFEQCSGLLSKDEIGLHTHSQNRASTATFAKWLKQCMTPYMHETYSISNKIWEWSSIATRGRAKIKFKLVVKFQWRPVQTLRTSSNFRL